MVAAVLGLTLGACGGDDPPDPVPIPTDAESVDEGVLGDGPTSGDIGVPDASTDATVAVDTLVADMGTTGPECPPATGYGLLAAPVAIGAGQRGTHSPRAVWNGMEWGLVYFAPVDGNAGDLQFQRINAMGMPVGQLHTIGRARLPKFDVAWNGGGYVITWIGDRDPVSGFTGIRVQVTGADGTPIGGPVELPDTFDAERIAMGWAQLSVGMLLFSRGNAGTGGLFSQPLDEGGQPNGPRVTLAAGRTLSPSVVFGNGNWGAAWLTPGAVSAFDVNFVLLGENGAVERTAQLANNTGAQSSISVAYGNDTFGLGWSYADEAGEVESRLTIIAGDGTVQATPVVVGPAGTGSVTDVSWHEPEFFGIAWDDANAGQQRLGVTRINTVGVGLDPVPIEAATGAIVRGATNAGTVSNLGMFYTLDPTPTPAGFSAEAQVHLGRIGACRQ